jgi:hypothetical protein
MEYMTVRYYDLLISKKRVQQHCTEDGSISNRFQFLVIARKLKNVQGSAKFVNPYKKPQRLIN